MVNTHKFTDEIFKDGFAAKDKAIASAKEIISKTIISHSTDLLIYHIGLLSTITTTKSPEELETSLNNDFYLFINFYLKLEIMSIQKYIFDLIFYLMKVSDTTSSSEFKKLINESMSTGVVISSIT